MTIDVDAIDSDSDLQTAISLSKESAAKEALARDGQDFVTIPWFAMHNYKHNKLG